MRIAACMETARFLELAGKRLFCVYHPPRDAEALRGGLVFVHPLLEEKKSAHRCLVETARVFASRGLAVLRIDLSGCGDSDGDLQDQSINAWQAQIVAARQWLTRRLRGRPAGVLGLRVGGTLALAATLTDPAVACVVLWEPVTDGAAWLRERRRQRQVREMLAAGKAREPQTGATGNGDASMDVDGFQLSDALVRDLETMNLGKLDRGVPAKTTLILQIGPSPKPSPSMKRLREGLQVAGSMPDLQVLRAPPFWNRLEPQPCPDAAEITGDWLSRIFPEASADTVGSADPDAADHAGSSLESALSAPDDERPVIICSDNVRLTGVAHAAAADGCRPAVMMLHGWGTYRIGPHRMFVHAARRFAAAGMPVLRVDFRGRGDSDGSMTETSIETMVDDAVAAWRQWLANEPHRPPILLGMCSGAKVAAALATRVEVRPAGVVLWSPEPPDAAQQAAGGARAVGRRTDILTAYWRKMRNPATWRKLLAGAVNWRLVHRAMFGQRGAAPVERRRDQHIYTAFARYAGPRLLIDGSADPMAERSRSMHREMAARAGAPLTSHTVAGADHNFYQADWEACVIERTLQWLLAVGDHADTPRGNDVCRPSGKR